MAARQYSGKKPQNLRHTLKVLLSYMGRHRFLLLAVAVLVTVSALANLLGTYMIRPIVNHLAQGSLGDLVRGVAVTAAIYICGAASAWGYTQTMVRAAQKVLYDIRRDLFAHLQTLPLSFFDTKRHGEVMGLFTNDVDTISDAFKQQLCHADTEFYPDDGHPGAAVCAELEAVADCGGMLRAHVFLYPLQRGQKQKILYKAAGEPGGPGRLHRGDDGGPEGGKGILP